MIPRTHRLRAAVLAAALGGALLGSGCRRPAAATAAAAPVRQVLRFGNSAEPQDLDPQNIQGITELNIVLALFDSLVEMDPHDLHPVPGQAETWEISPDGLTYTFHLRANLRWSNGEPLTADDFIQSYRRILTPTFAAEYAYLIYYYVQGAKEYYDGTLTDFSRVGFRAPDARTLVVSLKQPTPFLLKIIACHYVWDAVPVKTIARFGPVGQKGSHWTRAGNLVGSGPFLLTEWIPNQRIVVARNPYYWDAGQVKLDGIEFYPIDDQNVEERMFRTGQLDLTFDFLPNKLDTYRRDHPDELRIDPWLGIYYYNFNVTQPPFTDPRVRRAFALAIDREALVKDVMRGGQAPAFAASYPGTSGYVPRAHLTGGVAEARRLLAEAGFPGGRGLPPIELLYNTNVAYNRAMAEAIQAMWRQNLGAAVTLTTQEWKVYLDSMQTGHYQIARAGWIADYADPHVFLEIYGTGNGNNYTRWSNAGYDRLLHDALLAPDEAARYEIYQKMDAILVRECPIVPLFYYTKTYALSPRVHGWWPTLLDEHPYKYVFLQN
jgi:oligopeptide transport system substrate-binding protein